MKRISITAIILIGCLGSAHAEYVQLTSVMDLHTMGTDADGMDLANAFIAIFPPKAGPAGQFFKMRARDTNLEVPFVAGPWKGGKAILEYPRDLSYMEVSIYDKHGDRQRLYSVRAKAYESGRLSGPTETSMVSDSYVPPNRQVLSAPLPTTPGVIYPNTVSVYRQPSAQNYGGRAPQNGEATAAAPMYQEAQPPQVAVARLPKRAETVIPEPEPEQPDPSQMTEAEFRKARETQRQAQRKAYEKMKTNQDVAKDIFKQDDVIDKNSPKSVDENPAPMFDPRVAKLASKEEKKAVVAAAPLHGMDVNDPELGVRQVNLTDKFSGGRYGRHREYERRVVYGKRPASPVKDYDYYIDEVDRKKEIHILSYYRHEPNGRNKLVAVQRHDTMKFLSNYDIADDGPAKFSSN